MLGTKRPSKRTFILNVLGHGISEFCHNSSSLGVVVESKFDALGILRHNQS